MDCKRSDKYRTLKQLLLAILCVWTLVSCSWVKDDTEDCPYGFWLQLRYTYNILDVEAAPKYVTDAYVYIYTAEGHYVKRIHATQNELNANGYRIQVTGLEEGDYQFVVWSGLGNSQYAVAGDTQSMEAFHVSLAGDASRVASELPALFYGYLPTVHYDNAFATHDISLMKNTNQLACLVVPVSNVNRVSVEEYTMKVMAANGTMDVHNSLETETPTTYEPFQQSNVTFDDPDYGELAGAQFNLMTLRLMSDRDSRIILEQKSTGHQVFNISIPEYIGMIGSLYTSLGRPLSVQEYLDRQDLYTMVFYLSADLDQLVQLQVNSWRLRAINHLKL